MPFLRDDFGQLYNEYYADLDAAGLIRADLSGWRDTRSDAAELMPAVTIANSRLDRYYLDEGDALGTLKTDIVYLLSGWERREVSVSEVTIAPSVSSANLQVLIALARRGVRTVIFETPAYAVTINQAVQAAFNVVLLPTYQADGFRCAVSSELAESSSPCALWLTQPRMSLGYDQSVDDVITMIDAVGPSNYVVIDEATEQRYPSHLHLILPERYPNVIRTRGITKGLGLNGLRVACTIHHGALRDAMESTQDLTGISLDYFSLQAAATIARDGDRFSRMLTAANAQTVALRRHLDRLTHGSLIRPSPLVNGYIGSLFFRIPSRATYDSFRTRLLMHCRNEGTFAMLGNSMRFAFDPTYEFIRVNYFNRESHVVRGVESVLRFAASLEEEHL